LKHILRIRDVKQAHGGVRRIEKSFEMMWLFIISKEGDSYDPSSGRKTAEQVCGI
jgi:hypothetical protein